MEVSPKKQIIFLSLMILIPGVVVLLVLEMFVRAFYPTIDLDVLTGREKGPNPMAEPSSTRFQLIGLNRETIQKEKPSMNTALFLHRKFRFPNLQAHCGLSFWVNLQPPEREST